MPNASTERILFVDDEPNVLEALQRQFRRKFALFTAVGGQEGLHQLREHGPFAVVVSDMRMPSMDGIQFLKQARAISPDTVRIMLTGHADIEVAIQAINEGNIFRILTKPCSPLTLNLTLRAALDQYRLIVSERELLEHTLHGSVKVLTDVLALVHPLAFGRAVRMKRYVRGIAELLSRRRQPTAHPAGAEKEGRPVNEIWQYELAAMLSQVGCVALSPELLKKVYEGQPLSPAEEQLYSNHPGVGHDLIRHVPRLESVAGMIAYQGKRYDGSGFPEDGRGGSDIPLGARVLKAAADFDTLTSGGTAPREALAAMRARSGWYDSDVLNALRSIVQLESEYRVEHVGIRDICPGMILAENICTKTGRLLIAKGHELSDSVISHLESFVQSGEIREPICVLRAAEPTAAAGRPTEELPEPESEGSGQPAVASI